ncbi:efflux ABC transporter, permease, putative, partial [Acanthamoeba castellanii str. Neff]
MSRLSSTESDPDDPSVALLSAHEKDGNRGTLPRERKKKEEGPQRVTFSIRDTHKEEEENDVPLHKLLWEDAKRFSFTDLRISAALGVNRSDVWHNIMQGLLFWAMDFWVSLRYVSVDSFKNKKNFCIAVVTIIIAVAAIVALTAIVAKSPLVFVKLAENTVGEYDLLITPDGTPIGVEPRSYDKNAQPAANTTDGSPLGMLGGTRNSTAIILVIDSDKEKEIGLGRSWPFPALGERQAIVSGPLLRNIGAAKSDYVTLTIDIADLATDLGGFSTDQLDASFKKLVAMGIHRLAENVTVDFDAHDIPGFARQLEKQLNFTIPPLIVQMLVQAIINQTPDHTGIVRVNLDDILSDAVIDELLDQLARISSGQYTGNVTYTDLFKFSSDLEVAGEVEDSLGKWPSALGTVVVMEAKYIPFLLFKVEWLPWPIRDNARLIRSLMSNIPGYTLPPGSENFNVDKLLINFPMGKEDRLETYTKEKESRDLDMIDWTNQVSLGLGLDFKGSFTLPVYMFMRGTDIPQSFLSQILIGLVVILLLHSMLVIYSLLLSNTEEKTYEYGMLRALGLRHKSLIQLLTIQAVFFSGPGIAIGLLLAFFINVIVAYFIADYTSTAVNVLIGWTPVLVGVSLGLFMPIIANIIPIRRALSRTLRDALDVYHQKFSETVVKIVRLEEMGVSVEQTVWSVMMIVFGFMLLYVVPFAFRYQYWGIFLGLINATLLGMVMGLATVASILQGKIEKLMLHALMWRGASRLKVVVRKALSAHKDRNRKTALMFTTAVAFVIFAAAIFQIQTVSVGDNIRLLSGSDIFIQAFDWKQPLDEESMRDFLDTHKKDANSGIVGYTWTRISNMAGTPDGSVAVHGVEENMLESTYDQYLMLSAYDTHFSYAKTPHDKLDVVRSLFTDAGKAVTSWDKDLKIPPVVGAGKLVNITQYAQRHPSYFPDVPASAFPYYIERNLTTTYTQYIDTIVETAHEGLQIHIDQPMQFNIQFRITPDAVNTRLKYLAKPRAFASKFPALYFTWLKVLAKAKLPIIISIDSYNMLVNQVYKARMDAMKANPALKLPSDWVTPPPERPHKAKLLVKLKSGATRDQREFVINGLKNFIKHNR